MIKNFLKSNFGGDSLKKLPKLSTCIDTAFGKIFIREKLKNFGKKISNTKTSKID